MARRALTIVAGLIALTMVVMLVRHTGGSHSPGGSNTSGPKVVLYCATDREMAQDLIDQFQKETGIQVETKFDTEAAKAVGLVQAVREEKAHPQCDVLWGGGPLFCTMLADDSCLEPMPKDLIQAEGSAPHDPLGRWLGFASRYLVLIINTNVLPPGSRPHSYRDLTDPRFKGHIGIADPLFGIMASHVAALFDKLGEEKGRQWFTDLKRNDCAVCAGLADVKDRVASGELWFGITATDDAYVALAGGKPVVVVYPDQGPGEIGCFASPDTVAMIAGAPHPREAERLVRFLLTTRTEKVLAAGPAQSIGLLPESIVQDVRPAWIPHDLKTMDVDWTASAKAHPAATKAIKEILLDE